MWNGLSSKNSSYFIYTFFSQIITRCKFVAVPQDTGWLIITPYFKSSMGRSCPNPEQAHPTGLGQENLGPGLLSKKSWNLTTSVSLFTELGYPRKQKIRVCESWIWERLWKERIIEEERRRITPRPPSASKGHGLTIQPAHYSALRIGWLSTVKLAVLMSIVRLRRWIILFGPSHFPFSLTTLTQTRDSNTTKEELNTTEIQLRSRKQKQFLI